MDLSWVSLSSTVSIWWLFLCAVSALNIALWFLTRRYVTAKYTNPGESSRRIRALILLSGVYVFVCAFRSVLPRADVQRMTLFDTWLSSVLVGRSVATIAELSFVLQWAIILNHLAKVAGVKLAERISWVLVPLIFMAECFSWYAVITTNYLGNACEESTWTVTYTLLAIALAMLLPRFRGVVKYVIGFSIIGMIFYVGFMTQVDVPMYFHRWQADVVNAKPYWGFFEGIRNLGTHWVVVHESEPWRTEIPWMSLYFSLAVWGSLGLCYVPVFTEKLSVKPGVDGTHVS